VCAAGTQAGQTEVIADSDTPVSHCTPLRRGDWPELLQERSVMATNFATPKHLCMFSVELLKKNPELIQELQFAYPI
jgi:hypothetical protein